jgi:hypothetical protein
VETNILRFAPRKKKSHLVNKLRGGKGTRILKSYTLSVQHTGLKQYTTWKHARRQIFAFHFIRFTPNILLLF